MTGCPNTTRRTRHASVTGPGPPTLPVPGRPLQRVTGQQQRSNLVVGNLWPFLEEVAHCIERFRGGETDELVGLRRQPGGGIGRSHWDGQHHPPSPPPADRL